jgi:dephospho-CoA kinase
MASSWKVGLTGNVASGKSTVASIWAEEGIPVMSADALAREAVKPGSEGLRDVVDAFGPEMLSPDGTLDRGRLRALVFQDRGARERLEALLHPRIRVLRDAWVREQDARGVPLVVLEIPLLFEAGLEDSVDEIVFVDAPNDVRLSRLVERRGLDPAEARRMMDAQLDPAEKRQRSHHVVENRGTPEALADRARELLVLLRQRVEGGGA